MSDTPAKATSQTSSQDQVGSQYGRHLLAFSRRLRHDPLQRTGPKVPPVKDYVGRENKRQNSIPDSNHALPPGRKKFRA